MGFWTSDEEQSALMKRSKTKGPITAKPAPITSGVRGCDVCPLKSEWPRITSPRMRLSGNKSDPDILVLGEAPGEEEDRKGAVFVGPTGQFLRDHIPGRDMERIAFQNAVRCHPFGNRTPTKSEVYACSGYIDDDVNALPTLKVVLGAGQVPLSKFINETTITNIHGYQFPVQIGDRVLWYYPIMHPSFVMRNNQEARGYEGPAAPVFRSDINRFFREVDSWGKPHIIKVGAEDVKLPVTREEAESYIKLMSHPFGVDVETFSPPKGVPKPYQKGARLLCASISDGKTTIAFPIDGPQATTDWGLDLLLDTVAEHPWVAHSAGYELVWILWMAEQKHHAPPKNFDCTMAMMRLYHQSERILGLEIGSRIHLGLNIKRVMDVNPERITEYPIHDTLVYNGLDSWASRRIFDKLHNLVKRDHYDELLNRTDSMTRMEIMGLPVDAACAKDMHEHWSGIAAATNRKASSIYEVKEFTRHRSKEFNLGSPTDVGIALAEYGKVPLPKTAGGKQYSTDDQILQQLAPDNPLTRAALDYREADKLDGTYLIPLIEIPKTTTDGLIHPSYSTTLVSTYRSSSDAPNAQNYPKRKHREVRKAVVSPEGHVLVPIDYGQMQVRNLAMASEDRKLVKHLIDGRDIHTDWLNNLLTMHPDYLQHLSDKTGETDDKKIRKEGRNIIKSDFVFNSFFGGGADNVSARTSIPLRICQELQSELWEEYRDVRSWHKLRRNEYRDTGTVRGLTGVVLGRVIKIGNEPINFPIQNAEAEIVFRAQNELSQLSLHRSDPYLHPRINVHDDLTFILPNDERMDKYIVDIADVMLKVRFDWQIVPLVIEIKFGPNWCDLEDLVTLEGDYRR
jgi:uracil-DNA glycosylase family 4